MFRDILRYIEILEAGINAAPEKIIAADIAALRRGILGVSLFY